MVTIQELYDLEHTQAKSYLEQFTYPWEALKGIKDFIVQLGSTLGDDYQEVSPQVWVHRTATVAPTAYLALHHRRRHRGAPLCVHPGQRPGGRELRGRQLCGAEKRNSL